MEEVKEINIRRRTPKEMADRSKDDDIIILTTAPKK